MTKTAYLGLLADLHVGSAFGLWPADFRCSHGEHKHTEYQKWLLDQFNKTVDSLPKMDAVAIDGDLLDGESPVTKGKFTISPDIADQGAAAIRLLEPLRKKTKKMYLIRGTPFHEGETGAQLEAVGIALNCEKWGDNGTRYSGQVLERNWNGHTINVTHHTPNGLLYTMGHANKVDMHASVGEVSENLPHDDLIVSAHIHTDGWARVNYRHIVILPCWCFATPYGIKRMGYHRVSSSTKLGMVVMASDGTTMWPIPFDVRQPKREVLPL